MIVFHLTGVAVIVVTASDGATGDDSIRPEWQALLSQVRARERGDAAKLAAEVSAYLARTEKALRRELVHRWFVRQRWPRLDSGTRMAPRAKGARAEWLIWRTRALAKAP